MSFLFDRIRTLIANFFSISGEPSTANGNFFLWEGSAPGSENREGKERIRLNGKYLLLSNIHRPSITAFFPPPNTATGAAIIIAPGGGHQDLWISHEGYKPAEWFSTNGIACFVLKYRLARQMNSGYSVNEHALADIQRAIRVVRHRATEWSINKNAIGVMGFSAGGELAGLSAINFDHGKEKPADEIDKESSYPDFQALIYPADTRDFQISKKSPPAFLLAGGLDEEIAEDISNLYSQFVQMGIPASLHIYQDVDHGFGVQDSNTGATAAWPKIFLEWLSDRSFLSKFKA